MPRLLIAVDGSEASNRAVEAAGRLARELPQTEAVLLHVRELPVVYGELPVFDVEAVEQAAVEHQQRLLEAALTHARACGLQHVSTQGAVGLPAAEIARAATEHAVDQIVMGTRGRSLLAGMLLGSVAQRVVHLAQVPVLLVK